MTRDERVTACLLCGAIGDALGWPVEFMTKPRIAGLFGDGGITEPVAGSAGLFEITDDTQMTLFTAEGLLRAYRRGMERGICDVPGVVRHAYLRWLHTQGDAWQEVSIDGSPKPDGWLVNNRELFAVRAPGRTCVEALRSKKTGRIGQPLNNSKGCGGIMRMAPVGLIHTPDQAFRIGCECAALTQGHPTGYLSAGAFALMISLLLSGENLLSSWQNTRQVLITFSGHEETMRAVDQAFALAASGEDSDRAIEMMGKGWIAEEALAISIFCAARHSNDMTAALRLAVNHDGDSDSTGAITGNLIGVHNGTGNLPSRWLERLELKDAIVQMAKDIVTKYDESDSWACRYPGW